MREDFSYFDRELGQVTVEPDKHLDITIENEGISRLISLMPPDELDELDQTRLSVLLGDELHQVETKMGSRIRKFEKIAIVTVSGVLVAAGVVKTIKAWRNKEYKN